MIYIVLHASFKKFEIFFLAILFFLCTFATPKKCKTMKRTFIFLTMGLLAVGLLASCNKKENNNGTADGKGFKAITEQNGGGNSKTHGVLLDAGTLEVQWTQYDQIKVNNGSGTSTFETLDGNTTTGDFYLAGGMPFDFTSGDFTAIYPATNADGVENTVGNLSATFTLPATQAYTAEHPSSFAEKAMPMMAIERKM